MIKKLLNQVINIFSYSSDSRKIEEYLANSIDLADLENRMRELDKKGTYNRFYI